MLHLALFLIHLNEVKMQFNVWHGANFHSNIIKFASVFGSRLYNVKASRQRLQILMPNDNWLADAEIYFLGYLGIWHRKLIHFSTFSGIGAFQSVLRVRYPSQS